MQVRASWANQGRSVRRRSPTADRSSGRSRSQMGGGSSSSSSSRDQSGRSQSDRGSMSDQDEQGDLE
jgi:hypothetical protein